MSHHRRDSSGDVVHVIPTNNPPPDNWFPNLGDTSVWATEDDYNRVWAVNPDGDNNGPPNKKTRGSPSPSSSSSAAAAAASNRTKAIGKMFFKTKLCCKFRAGTCPYVTNCNFAHTVEELRRPPPNWQEIVAAAAQEEERSGSGTPSAAAELPREEYQIPSLVSSTADESGRSFKGRHCKKFYTEEGCPYGESCTFMHDEASRNRESVAISLGPGGYGGGSGSGGGGNSNVVVLGGGASGIDVLKPSNWKTRICNKWEITGYCPFGAKCHFAHGAAELHRFGGGLVEGEGKDGGVSSNPDIKQTGPNPKGHSDTTTTLLSPGVVPHNADASYHSGVALQRASSAVTQKPGIRTHQKWKGPAKISRIYGDWIDDIE
ncbi:Zinc finger CCCH domain-containing protein 12 [Hirschfeldia incana]|nr:Zinc finger CCCH domain-containing protein 12 [Hirschfeldia incana]